jgi:hypothetical protein
MINPTIVLLVLSLMLDWPGANCDDERLDDAILAEGLAVIDDGKRFNDLRRFGTLDCGPKIIKRIKTNIESFKKERREMIDKFLKDFARENGLDKYNLSLRAKHLEAYQKFTKLAEDIRKSCEDDGYLIKKLAQIMTDRLYVLEAGELWINSALKNCRDSVDKEDEDCDNLIKRAQSERAH